MDNTGQLVEILRRLNAGEDVEKVRQEATALLENIDATELSLAEQQLIDEGMAPEDLRGLCVIHMEMLADELEGLKACLEQDHPLRVMIDEHDAILGFLGELEALNKEMQKLVVLDPNSAEIARLRQVAENLVGAEKHHQREEEALFPAMERLGITGPPRIMRLEHDDLRPHKEELLDLVEEAKSLPLEKFKAELARLSKYIVFALRDHIFKENYILYPTAFESIAHKEAWAKIKEQCDDIGYCTFTPGV